jgi:hypothetical protein
MDAKPYKPAVRELASRIYIELAVRCLTIEGKNAKMSTAAEDLATLSFRLAESFQNVEEALGAAAVPKKAAFSVEASDIAAWSKPAG